VRLEHLLSGALVKQREIDKRLTLAFFIRYEKPLLTSPRGRDKRTHLTSLKGGIGEKAHLTSLKGGTREKGLHPFWFSPFGGIKRGL
jgi:hypothetical protein